MSSSSDDSSPSPSPSPTSKRKLDDFLNTPPMKKDYSTLPSCSSSPKNHQLQFFVRLISNKTLVLRANQNDTVSSLHETLHQITKIPLTEQRLIFNGKQLQLEKTLSESLILNDSMLHLASRMRSTGHPLTWRLLVDMVGLIFKYCKSGPSFVRTSYVCSYGLEFESNKNVIMAFLSRFLSMSRQYSDCEQAIGHLKIFLTSLAPLALVRLYVSKFDANKLIADEAIRHFVSSCKLGLTKSVHRYCGLIVLEFCKLLGGGVGEGDLLYVFCRSSLGAMVGESNDDVENLIDVREFFRFVKELAGKLSKGLELSIGVEVFATVLPADVGDFAAFLFAIRNGVVWKLGGRSRVRLPLVIGDDGEEQIEMLYEVFKDLLGKMDLCLGNVEGDLGMMGKENIEKMSCKWDQYLAILKELNGIAKMFEGAEEVFWGMLVRRKVSFCYLIVSFAKRNQGHEWIHSHKEVTDFEARRHLVMMMFPDVKEEYDDLHEMMIDRSELLQQSFSYIQNAEAESLHGGIFMEFKNEEANGPGVLREWFVLVCQEIFNPQFALFAACPNDRRRFFPNPASKVDPLHLEYFSVSGRVIALALMHKIQVGVVFDRVFFVQLAGKNVSLEDICDADPYLYNSCKKILDLDAEVVDQDALGLTFVREVDELGSMKVVELCAGGKNISVTSMNRKEYVHLLIQHSFVTSISEQVARFTRGFADIMNSESVTCRALLQKSFFDSIDLEDFDLMLHGSESDICVEDWKAHTKYDTFKESDPHIRWFWKIVEEMSAEERKSLLFFWTSVKYLPVEGFRGLSSPLYIYRIYEPSDRLPSSHTCFYRLDLPLYPSKSITHDRLRVVIQEHVGCSFGTS